MKDLGQRIAENAFKAAVATQKAQRQSLIDPNMLPDNIRDDFTRYVTHKVPTGGFLEAVLSNNLMEAVGRADHTNIRLIPEIVSYVYSDMPAASHGSPETVRNWLNRKE